MPQLAMNKTFAPLPLESVRGRYDTKAATKNMSRHVIGTKDGVLSENVPRGAVDDDEFTRVSI
jgi:hypothetical protein